MRKFVPIFFAPFLTGCIGNNIADVAQAAAAAEAAKAAQEAAQAAQIAAGGLSAAVVFPWIIATIAAVTLAGLVWARWIIPAAKPQKTVVIKQRPAVESHQPAALPEGQAEKPMSMEEIFRLKMMRDIMRDDR